MKVFRPTNLTNAAASVACESLVALALEGPRDVFTRRALVTAPVFEALVHVDAGSIGQLVSRLAFINTPKTAQLKLLVKKAV